MVIAAERRGDTVEQLIERIIKATADRTGGREDRLGTTEPGRGDSFSDLWIGATALSLGFHVLTGNPRDFQRIPGLSVVQF